MKYLILILTLSLAGLDAKEPKVVLQEEDTPKVVIYGDSGNDLQEGYIKNNRLHGYWASYNKLSKTLAFGKYNRGEKAGKWFFWSEGTLTKVNYSNIQEE
jgi:antitoxin component YwqK of YwqJK toxin-antitoxin module|tara:strand:+ start:4201 stop:4500 length:300 start_codon:yes stop_codon:yes gene_type:complete